MSADTHDEIDDFFAAQRRARASGFVRAVKFSVLTVFACACGLGVALGIAHWDHNDKVERKARYDRGELRMARKGVDIDDTSAGLLLPGMGGFIAALVVFAAGRKLAVREPSP